MTASEYRPCLSLAALPDRSPVAVVVAGTEIVLCRSGDAIFAVENRCSHADQPLGCGIVRHGWIACPAHGGRFDLATGEAVGAPASAPIRTFPVRVAGDCIEVLV